METIWKQNIGPLKSGTIGHRRPFLLSKTIVTSKSVPPGGAVETGGSYIIRDRSEVSLWHADTYARGLKMLAAPLPAGSKR
jgi:hypothetical protein